MKKSQEKKDEEVWLVYILLRSLSSHFSRHAPPRHHTSRMRMSVTTISPAQREYKPPSPIAIYSAVSRSPRKTDERLRTCSGAATSVAMKAVRPRNALFAATADEERPVFASTMYARVLV